MFKIEVNVSGTIHNYLSANKHEDDFLQFWPAQMTQAHGQAITSAEISAFKISEADALTISSLPEGQHIDSDTSGQLKIVNTADSAVLSTITCTALSQWPYDANGNFLGNN